MPREPILGMPDDLADALWDEPGYVREAVLANWEAIGEEGRELYRRYLKRAHLRRGRKERCKLAIVQLIEPERPLPIPDSGGGG